MTTRRSFFAGIAGALSAMGLTSASRATRGPVVAELAAEEVEDLRKLLDGVEGPRVLRLRRGDVLLFHYDGHVRNEAMQLFNEKMSKALPAGCRAVLTCRGISVVGTVRAVD
jgi:hypothetical protein